MKSLATIKALRTEGANIEKRIEPLSTVRAEKWGQLTTLRKRQTLAVDALDAATEKAAMLAGQRLTGDATAAQVKAAEQERAAAEASHRETLDDAAAIRALESVLKGLDAAAAPLGQRLAAIGAEERAAADAYVRELGDLAGTAYAEAARVLAEKFADVLAVNMALARMDGANPDLLIGAWDKLAVPAFNITTASAPAGYIMDTSRARLLAPAALAALKARVSADDVVVPGL